MNEYLHNYKMVLMYDGTLFCGWQIQHQGISIQQTIEEAIQKITKEDVKVIGSGRTDAGVHALGQTAHFKIAKELDLYRFHYSLNALLPPEIRVKEISPAPLSFHAQYSAIRKTYRYHVSLSKTQSPFNRLYAWHFIGQADISLLKKAAGMFLGTHDFTSFANEAHRGSASKDPIRTLMRLDVVENGKEIALELEADGFLYKMVRNIVGTLFDAAIGRTPLDSIPDIFAAKDRRKAGAAAPPQGLFLLKVDY